MTLPWLPVRLVDIGGSAAVFAIALWCIALGLKWRKESHQQVFREYVFMLTIAIGAFALSRSFGHLVKQALLYGDRADSWLLIAPFSGSINTVTFVAIFAFSVYFDRMREAEKRAETVALDLAMARATARSMRESETRLRTIFNGMEDAIYVIDEDYRVRFFNRKLKKLLPDVEIDSQCFSALMGLSVRCEGCLHPRVIKEGKTSSREFMHPILSKTVSLVEIPMVWIDGRKVKLTVMRDISERKLLEAQLLHAQKLEAVGTLAGGLAHEINNALTPILAYSELVLSESGKNWPLRGNIEKIQHCTLRASELIRRILTFSRRQVIKPSTQDLNDLVRNTFQMLKRLVEENVYLELHLAEDLKAVSVDPGQIEQALTNLVVNARHAVSDGGKISIFTKDRDQVAARCWSCNSRITGAQVCLTVADDGTGMNPETKAKVFEPYFTTKDLDQGTGLGLAMVHGIVHQHRGHIHLESELGQGSSFTICLPSLQKAEVEVSPKPEGGQPVPAGKETILLVEDEQAVLESSLKALDIYGYRVLGAESGDRALEIVMKEGRGIDLVVTDVVMPGMNGRELAQRVWEVLPEMKVLFMSGYDREIIVRQGLLEEKVTLLRKPFTPQALAAEVRKIIDRHE